MAYSFIAPDKPIRTSEDFIDDMIDNDWIAESKLDGWRMEVGKFDGKLHTLSRRDTCHDVCDELIEQLQDIVPEGCAIDCEWLSTSRIKAVNTSCNCNLPIKEMISVFDVTWHNDRYLNSIKLRDRISIDVIANLPVGNIEDIFGGPRIFRCPYVSGENAIQFYELQKSYPISEGIVLKKLNSPLIGNSQAGVSVKSKYWYKIKYRG